MFQLKVPKDTPTAGMAAPLWNQPEPQFYCLFNEGSNSHQVDGYGVYELTELPVQGTRAGLTGSRISTHAHFPTVFVPQFLPAFVPAIPEAATRRCLC